jgi:3-hydroxyisobutyrate dehydrogenase-like beta-hydroxyacid dehydrogenase
MAQTVGQTIGMIGLGLMGTAMSRNLIAAGVGVIGYDVLPEKVKDLVAAGGKAAGSAAEAAKGVEAVITALPNAASVESALLGPQGVAEGGRPGLVAIEMSTLAPETSRSLARRLSEAGIAMLDAPVSGTSGMVAKRDCIIMVGGDRAAFDRCHPILDLLSRRAFHIGPSGAGAQLKLVTNLIMGVNSLATAEGLALGMKAGLDPRLMLEVLRHSAAASRMMEVRGPLMVERHYEAQMKIEMFLKDIGLILENGQHLKMPLPLAAAMQQMFTAAYNDGRGLQEMAAVIEAYRRLGGVKEPD